MVKASELFKRGEFNFCEMKSDSATGERTVTISKIGWKHGRKFKVKSLYELYEQIIEDEEVKE